MITLHGTYTDDDRLAGDFEYVCRAIPYGGKYYNAVGEELEIRDGDVLMMLGNGTWFALYRSAGTHRDKNLWEPGDIITREGNDEQELLWIDHSLQVLRVRCVKEPPSYGGGTEPWCRLGDIEDNLIGRYSWVRSGRLSGERSDDQP